jgi:hypothetical protein
MIATPRGSGRAGVFLHWLLLRGAVNGAAVAGLDQLMSDRVERWATRSHDLEHDWRGQ